MHGWRCGGLLIRPAGDAAVAAWSAAVLDGLSAEGLRLAQPVRASDGRWVVAGCVGVPVLPGAPSRATTTWSRASLRLHQAMVGVRRPRLLDDQDDLRARANAAAWGEQRIAMDPGAGGDLFDEFASYRRPVVVA